MQAHRQSLETRSGARGESASSVPDWAGLIPAGIATLGAPSRPVERLIETQAAVYRLIVWLGALRLRWPGAARHKHLPRPHVPARP